MKEVAVTVIVEFPQVAVAEDWVQSPAVIVRIRRLAIVISRVHYLTPTLAEEEK